MATTTVTISSEPVTDTSAYLVITFASGVKLKVLCGMTPGNAGTPVQPDGVVMTGAE